MSQLTTPPPNGAPAQPLIAPRDRDELERKLLSDPLTEGYRPTLPLWQIYSANAIPQFFLLRDIELMMTHPIVRTALDYFKGGIAGAEFWGGPKPGHSAQDEGKPVSEDPAVAEFVLDQCRRFWDRGVPKVQGGYEYGWIGLELTYAEENGRLTWTDFVQFSPRDVFLLTVNNRPVGIRVKNIVAPDVPKEDAGQGSVDLWTSSPDIPAKGIWYAHNPRYSAFYGQSQLLGAWRPWRRLGWQDGAEMVADGGIYRFAYCGPIVKYPDEDYQAPPGTPNTTMDSQGRARRFARDMARMMAEQGKAGAGVGVPSTQYPPEQGGGDKWGFEYPKSGLNVEHIVLYIKYLIDQVRFGVGVPPELFEASEGGSGYSGRSIPLEGFMLQQQRLADALLLLFVKEVLGPLVRWNFGPVPFNVEVKSLLETKRRAQMGKQPAGQQPGQTGTNGLMNPSQPSPDGSLPVPGTTRGFDQPQPSLAPTAGFSLGSEERVKALAELIRRAGRAA